VNPDFEALLAELNAAESRYLVVGAHAVALHSRPRATGDLDPCVDPTAENATRVHRALRASGEAWPSRVQGTLGRVPCGFLGRAELIRNKRATGRPRDLADLGEG